ncbi:YkgJ family cysteine cluster protein [Phascolarctobacterium sp.]|uniref:YkgJ family cysteine cluster protein n=1 Tax=Phascolarctobacterium sp. TaxID=2049039 RepID=UPI00386379E7
MFKCSKCGICCRNINLVPELKQFDLGNGVCMHLKDNVCDIYESRPDICRVDVMYNKKYSILYTREEFYRMNEIVCEMLKTQS